MGFFGSGDKTQTTTNNQTGASEDGLAVSGLGGAGAKDSATSISTGIASVNKFGSTEVVGSTIRTNENNTGSIVYGQTAEDVRATLADVTGGIASLVKAQSDAAADQVAAAVSGISDLALAKGTDGESTKSNLAVWVALGAFAVLGLVFYKK
jgi:hypothetical protein